MVHCVCCMKYMNSYKNLVVYLATLVFSIFVRNCNAVVKTAAYDWLDHLASLAELLILVSLVDLTFISLLSN